MLSELWKKRSQRSGIAIIISLPLLSSLGSSACIDGIEAGPTFASGGEAGEAPIPEPSGGTANNSAGDTSVGGEQSSGGAAGSASSDAGSAGTGGEAASLCPDDECKRPAGIRLTQTTALARAGGNGGSLYEDLCAEDEVMVGLSWEFGDHQSFPGRPRFLVLQVMCSKLAPSASGDVSIETQTTRKLTLHGTPGQPGAVAGTTTCAANQIIAGSGAKYGPVWQGPSAWYNGMTEITLSCVTSTVSGEPGSYKIDFSSALNLPAIGSAQAGDRDFAVVVCPAGQVARGVQIRSGAWIDALGLICSPPHFVYPAGAPCTSGSTCASGVCQSVCR